MVTVVVVFRGLIFMFSVSVFRSLFDAKKLLSGVFFSVLIRLLGGLDSKGMTGWFKYGV